MGWVEMKGWWEEWNVHCKRKRMKVESCFLLVYANYPVAWVTPFSLSLTHSLSLSSSCVQYSYSSLVRFDRIIKSNRGSFIVIVQTGSSNFFTPSLSSFFTPSLSSFFFFQSFIFCLLFTPFLPLFFAIFFLPFFTMFYSCLEVEGDGNFREFFSPFIPFFLLF